MSEKKSMPVCENPDNFRVVKIIVPKKLPQGSRLVDLFDSFYYADMHGSNRHGRCRVVKDSFMDEFVPYDTVYRDGRFIVNSDQLLAIVTLSSEVWVRVLNLGSLRLEKSQVISNIKCHDKIDNIYVEIMDGEIIIENPEWTGWKNLAFHEK